MEKAGDGKKNTWNRWKPEDEDVVMWFGWLKKRSRLRSIVGRFVSFGFLTLEFIWNYWMALTSVLKNVASKILPGSIIHLFLTLWSHLHGYSWMDKINANLVNLLAYAQLHYLNPVKKFCESWVREYGLANCEEIEMVSQPQPATEVQDVEPEGQVVVASESSGNGNVSDIELDEKTEQAIDSSDFVVSSSDDDYEQQSLSDNELSSGTEAVSSESSSHKMPQSGPEMISQIIAQAEWYFSDEHLAIDSFLLKHCRRRADGYVSLKLVAGLRKVRQASRDFPTVLAALRLSDKLEVDSEGSKVRRRDPLPPELKTMPIVSKVKKEKRRAMSPSTSDTGEKSDESSRMFDQAQYSPSGSSTMPKGVIEGHRLKTRVSGSNVNEYQNHGNPGYRTRYNAAASNGVQVTYRRRSISPPNLVVGEHSGFFPLQQTSKGNRAPRPKSMAIGENLMIDGMSPWLMRRKAAAEGHVVVSSVIRQPRGPDGTRGFMMGHRGSLVRVN